MRNLAGRLTARSIPELTRIAEFWQTVVTGRDRHAVVGQLYREMREPRSARDAWTRLEPPERTLIQLLALDDEQGDASRTIPELAAALGWDEDETREIAIALYRKGILYREGDDDELPIGQLPRVFLPRELTTTFRRVQDEIDAGPLQRVPLPALLALLDDNELEEAARHWGIDVVPGLLDREDVTGQLLDALADEERRTSLVKTLQGDAARLWELLSDTTGTIAPLDSLTGAAGMAGEGVALAQRRRTAIGKLEERLLAWHTYGTGEERFLFIPPSFADQPTGSIERQTSTPKPVDADSVDADPWIHPWAVPWDLLTLLRAVTGPAAPVIGRFDDAPRTWRDDIAPRLWNADRGEPLTSYLSFLAALGRQENVLQGGERGNDALEPGRSWKSWRSRTFADQFAHLIWWWNASPEWIEGAGISGVIVNNATLPQFRRKVMVLLASLEPGVWFETESLALWVATLDPDILGDEAAIATAAALDIPAGHPAWPVHATAAAVRAALLSAFAWFGLVETGVGHDGVGLIRPTDMLRLLDSTAPVGDLPAPGGPPIVIHQDLTIDLVHPTPLRVWALSAFSDARTLRPVATYQMTEPSLRRALDAGASLSTVTGYLESETGDALPADVLDVIQAWPGIEKRIAIGLVARLIPDRAERTSQLETALREAGWEPERHGDGLEVMINPAKTTEQLASLSKLIRQLGFQDTTKLPLLRQSDGEE